MGIGFDSFTGLLFLFFWGDGGRASLCLLRRSGFLWIPSTHGTLMLIWAGLSFVGDVISIALVSVIQTLHTSFYSPHTLLGVHIDNFRPMHAT
jgi:hypothetical protein